MGTWGVLVLLGALTAGILPPGPGARPARAGGADGKDPGPAWVPTTPADSTAADSAGADSAGAPYRLPGYRVETPTLSTADKMTLDEIIDRCVEGEKTKLAGHHDVTVTLTLRTVVSWRKKRLVTDAGYLAYQDESGFGKSVRLGERERKFKLEDGAWVYDKDEGKDKSPVTLEVSDNGKGLQDVPFFLAQRSEYDFKLFSRTLEGDHVIFKVAFSPKSDFKPLPSGIVYVDTDAFRIIHEEFTFEKQNPLPLLLKNVKRISREWRQLPTGEWVVSRILADVDLRGGWTGVMPESVTFALALDDYRFDQGYDAARFGKR